MDKRLEVLFEYTKFHIGLYTGLGTALVAAMSGREKFAPSSLHGPLWAAIGCILIAGLAGGVIASNIPEHLDFDDFKRQPLGFWRLEKWRFFKKGLTYSVWARIEHTSFWAGIFLVLFAAIVWRA